MKFSRTCITLLLALAALGAQASESTGTAAHVVPSTGTVGVLFTQVQMTGPTSTLPMREFWQYAFSDV